MSLRVPKMFGRRIYIEGGGSRGRVFFIALFLLLLFLPLLSFILLSYSVAHFV